jgi:predicted component of type VI protein secretion system
MRIRVTVAKVGTNGGALPGAEYVVDGDRPLTFGRAADQNSIHLPDEKRMVSSRHGRIEVRADGLHVVDLGSLNGTEVDGLRVGESGVRLEAAHEITVCDYRLQVEVLPEPEPVEDLDATVFYFDPEVLAEEAWAGLCTRFTADRRLSPAARAQALQEELRGLTRRMAPLQAKAVLQRVLARTGEGASTEIATDAGNGSAGLAEPLRRFAESLVPGVALTEPSDAVKFVDLARGFLTAVLRWLSQCIEARAEFEEQFGAEVTMVFERSNNPLKTMGPEQLGKYLFDWSAARQAEVVQNQLDHLLRDLSQHQLGLLMGAKEAVAALLQRLAPEAIEAIAQKDAGWLSSKGAKAWDIYRQIHREFREERSKLFHEVVSPAIRQGYLASHDGTPPSSGG